MAIPAGFQPEGIAVSARGTAYTGSLLDGSVYRFDLTTGAGDGRVLATRQAATGTAFVNDAVVSCPL